MSGGIIIRRAKKLIEVAVDPEFYDGLSPSWKAQIDAIAAKAEGQRTLEDCTVLAAALMIAVHC